MEEIRTATFRRQRTTLGFLVVIYTLNMVDRQILAILVEPIKSDLGLSDTQLGVLTGLAFALFYAILGIPIARVADRSDRVTIISIALAIWSAMTVVSGFVQNFFQMVVARVGVGVGEAGCTPAAHSMITDLFPIERRASALSIYQLGGPLGMLTGFLVGGWVNELWGWRAAFLTVGFPGVLFAILTRMFVRDPGRTGSPAIAQAQPGMLTAVRVLWRGRSFRHISLGFALAVFSQMAMTVWLPAFLIRLYGLTTGEVGTILGPVVLLGGVGGTLLGGFISDRLGLEDRRWYVWTSAWALLVASPAMPFLVFAETPSVVVGVAFLPALFSVMFMGPSFAMVQSLSPVHLRAMASAVVLLLANLIGMGLGPLVVGFLSDMLQPGFGSDSLRYALLVTIVSNVWAAAHFFWAGRTLREDLQQVSAVNESN